MQAKENVVFVGPGSQAIKAMGDKIESKRVAAAAKVNLIPGYDGEVDNEVEAVKVANDIGNYLKVVILNHKINPTKAYIYLLHCKLSY